MFFILCHKEFLTCVSFDFLGHSFKSKEQRMKKIQLILTGGTFGMVTDNNQPFKVSKIEHQLLDSIPELKQIAEISTISLFNIDSSDVQPKHWVKLAEQIEQNYHHFDGFVVVHGTDTMAFTATALSFMLTDIKKPVIFTGSQRPLSEIRSDARLNLINSVQLATYDIPEVSICFNNKLFRGNRSKKMSLSNFDAFNSPNFLPLADIGTKIELSSKIHHAESMFQSANKFDTNVISFPIYPGVNPNGLMFLAESNLNGIILEAYGAGNVPILDYSFVPLIKTLNENNKIVAIKSQCPFGKVDLELYEGGNAALNAGAISCSDMTREASVVKMMFLLGNFPTDKTAVKKHFCRSIAGELTE